MPNNVIYLDPPSADPAVNRDMINAKLLAAAISGDWVSGEGTYEIAHVPSDYKYIQLQAGTRIFGPKTPGGLKFKFKPIGSAPPGTSKGFYTDNADWFQMEDITIEGSGEEMGHCVLSSYAGTASITNTFVRVTITGAKFAYKAQGGKTNSRMVDCNWKGWGTSFLQTHALNADGSVPLDKIGARVEILGGTFESYVLAGHELDREHSWYINPTFQVYIGGAKATGNRFWSYQCNGPALPGHGNATLVDVEVTPDCGGGVQTHPTAQMRLIRPKLRPKASAIGIRSGGVYAENGEASVTAPIGEGASPGPAIFDNETVDYNGVYMKNMVTQGDPGSGSCFIQRNKPGALPWVFENQQILQTHDYFSENKGFCYAVFIQKIPDVPAPIDAMFIFRGGDIGIQNGQLWGWSNTPGGTIITEHTSVRRGIHCGPAIVPAGASATVI
jgi:hypothetical protein